MNKCVGRKREVLLLWAGLEGGQNMLFDENYQSVQTLDFLFL
jgi:hypothetical protein